MWVFFSMACGFFIGAICLLILWGRADRAVQEEEDVEYARITWLFQTILYFTAYRPFWDLLSEKASKACDVGCGVAMPKGWLKTQVDANGEKQFFCAACQARDLLYTLRRSREEVLRAHRENHREVVEPIQSKVKK